MHPDSSGARSIDYSAVRCLESPTSYAYLTAARTTIASADDADSLTRDFELLATIHSYTAEW